MAAQTPGSIRPRYCKADEGRLAPPLSPIRHCVSAWSIASIPTLCKNGGRTIADVATRRFAKENACLMLTPTSRHRSVLSVLIPVIAFEACVMLPDGGQRIGRNCLCGRSRRDHHRLLFVWVKYPERYSVDERPACRVKPGPS
jgi:hypothetical protein